MLSLYMLGNALLIVSYVALAYLSATWSALPTWAKIPTLAFFLLCGTTHADLLLHAWTGAPIDRVDMSAPFHVVVHVAQGISAATGALGVWVARHKITQVLTLVAESRLTITDSRPVGDG